LGADVVGEARGRINDQALFRFLVEGRHSQAEAARHFGVTEAAVSKRVKKLRLNMARHVGLERARDVADRGLDVVAELHRLNREISSELDWALSEARRPDGDRKGLQAVVVDLAGEVRKQLSLQLDILRALTDVRAIADFQKEVLDAIGEVAPDTRATIIERLVARRALRSALHGPAAGP
jgi:transposase-like protein